MHFLFDRGFFSHLHSSIVITALGLGIAASAQGQEQPPYLKAASLYIATDGWVDMWLNGIPIRESQRTTPDNLTGPQKINCLPEHLCYFGDENILAIENDNAFNDPEPLNKQIGFAYVLRLYLSDGTEITLSSNDTTEHKAFTLPGREYSAPKGWHSFNFNDAGWGNPYAIGTQIPGVAVLPDPATRLPFQFLSAGCATYQAQYPGERHLYRRKFSLNISPNPHCLSGGAYMPKRVPERNPRPSPPLTPTLVPLITSATFTPIPIPTFTPQPILIWTPPFTPTPFPIWTPTPFPTAVPTPRVVPTRRIVPQPAPTPVPTKLPPVPKRPRWKKPTPTPIPGFTSQTHVESYEQKATPVTPRLPTPLPTLAANPSAVQAQAQTIVFQDWPANIYVSFADGVGVYRLEVLDASLRHLRSLYEKKVVGQKEDWVEWDGKDDEGKNAPKGVYTVLFTKDGKLLTQMIMLREEVP